jgi:CDP-diacylglycerol--glycerol-3-phosphate 3-phosphatidyltransferase
MASRQAQKSPPPAEPRSARWNAWLCALTNPGRVRREGKADYDCTPVATSAVPAPLAQLPNALTLFRLGLIPVFAALVLAADEGKSWPAAIVFAVAGVTDQVDGFLARRWDVESAFGKVADPLADRLMIDVAVILLWHADRLPWVALAIPARDVLLIAATPLAVRRGYRFEVNLLGKAATWLLYASLAFVMVTSPDAHWPLWIFWTGFALAVASLVPYTFKAWREAR